MWQKILPGSIDNACPGNPAALWLFWFITAVTIGRSLAHILLPDGGAQSIATVPLDQFSREGAAAVITSFALWGLSQLLLSVVMVLVAVRYRGLIPAVYLLILMEHLGRIAIGLSKPLPTLTTPPGATGNLVFIAVAAIGLALCFREARSD